MARNPKTSRRTRIARRANQMRRRIQPSDVNIRRSDDAVPRPFKSQTTSTFRMCRTYLVGALTKPASADGGFAWSYALSDVPGASGFTQIFDQFMITRVIVRFHYQGGAPFPSLIFAVDRDSAAVPATLSVVQQYANAEVFDFSPHSPTVIRYFAPNPSSSTAIQNTRDRWVDCSSPSTAHYGLVAWGEYYNNAVTGQGTITVTETLEVTFRGQR